jgi:hypothetical protein
MPCADHGPMHGRVMSYSCLYSKWVALSRAVYSSGTRVTELPRLVLQHVKIRDYTIALLLNRPSASPSGIAIFKSIIYTYGLRLNRSANASRDSSRGLLSS